MSEEEQVTGTGHERVQKRVASELGAVPELSAAERGSQLGEFNTRPASRARHHQCCLPALPMFALTVGYSIQVHVKRAPAS